MTGNNSYHSTFVKDWNDLFFNPNITLKFRIHITINLSGF